MYILLDIYIVTYIVTYIVGIFSNRVTPIRFVFKFNAKNILLGLTFLFYRTWRTLFSAGSLPLRNSLDSFNWFRPHLNFINQLFGM